MPHNRRRRPPTPPRPPEPCRHCGEPVIFAMDEDTGSWLCLTPEPDAERGNVFVRPRPVRGKRTCKVLGNDLVESRREAGLPLHRQHLRDCSGSARVADRAAGVDA